MAGRFEPNRDLPLPTPRMYLRGPDLHLQCDGCRHGAYADLAALVATGRGDVPLIELRFRCGRCGSRDVHSVVSGARHAGYS